MTAICTLASIAVQFAESGRVFHRGDVVDLDEVVIPASKDRKAQTWRDALGKHAHAFVEQVEPQELLTDAGLTQE